MSKVLIAIPCRPDSARYIDFYRSLSALNIPEGSKWAMYPGFFPDFNINNAVKEALQGNFTHIFISDDDQILLPNVIFQLLKHDVDIVSCNLVFKTPPFNPYLFKTALDDGKVIAHTFKGNERGLVEVASVATGGLLVKTDVFRSLKFPWFTTNETLLTYDIYFSHTAKLAGYKMYYDLDAICGHLAVVHIWPKLTKDGWKTVVVFNNELEVEFPQAERVSETEIVIRGASYNGQNK